jgi:hypothetical protein
MPQQDSRHSHAVHHIARASLHPYTPRSPALPLGPHLALAAVAALGDELADVLQVAQGGRALVLQQGLEGLLEARGGQRDAAGRGQQRGG